MIFNINSTRGHTGSLLVNYYIMQRNDPPPHTFFPEVFSMKIMGNSSENGGMED